MKKRSKRAQNIIDKSEMYLVSSDKGGYIKLCARVKKRDRMVRVGTFARIACGTLISKDQMRELVKHSLEVGRVLGVDEVMPILLGQALSS